MQLSDFDYELPESLIAQEPLSERDQSRLMVIERQSGAITHHVFHELPALLRPGDLLVLNDSRVLPARLYGHRERTGGKWEGLFLREPEPGVWELMCKTRGYLRPGEEIVVDPLPLRLRFVRKLPNKHWLMRPSLAGDCETLLVQFGHVPLPKYVRQGRDVAADRERYQTIYARRTGSVAAPTAGLHFTPATLSRLQEAGIAIAYVTLHVGPGTFRPIQAEDVASHQMHPEWCEISAETVAAIDACRARGGRVIAVGSTALRALEAAALNGPLAPWRGETNLFILPGFLFRVADGLLTNFHLPRSTLVVLVSAFAGTELIRRAYRLAIEQRYRFYSYGDAMLIL